MGPGFGLFPGPGFGCLRAPDLACLRGPGLDVYGARLRAPDLACLRGPVPGARLRAPDLARLRGPGPVYGAQVWPVYGPRVWPIYGAPDPACLRRGPRDSIYSGRPYRARSSSPPGQPQVTGAVSERLNSLSDIYSSVRDLPMCPSSAAIVTLPVLSVSPVRLHQARRSELNIPCGPSRGQPPGPTLQQGDLNSL